MLKALFFKFVDVLLFFSKKNFHVLSKYEFESEDGMVHIRYIYNNKQYVYIGPEKNFPPTIKPGFVPCIISAHTVTGDDVTDIVKQCAGPKNELNAGFESRYIIGTRYVPRIIWDINYGKVSFSLKPIIKPADTNKNIIIKNVFNQISVLGKT